MTGVFSYRYALLCSGIIAVFLTGCVGSAPTRFYTLSSMESPAHKKQVAEATRDVIVALGPVSIPDYLDRPQIVTRSGQNELAVDDFHRWAGSLETDITRVLIENLSALLPPDRYHVVSWIQPAQSYTSIAHRVAVDVIRFDGTYGDSVSMKVQWAVFRKDREALVMHASIIEPVTGNDYRALVEAMSRVMESLSRDIADTISSLEK